MSKVVTLSDALVNLRKELQGAQQRAEGEGLKFKVEDIEVEFQVMVSTEGMGEVGADFWVLKTKTGGKKTDQLSHKIKLRLTPENQEGGDVRVSGTIPSE